MTMTDKYIKMLFIKLSPRYKIIVTTVMFYDDEREKFSNIIKLKIKNRFSGEIHNADCSGKRELISELIKWLDD